MNSILKTQDTDTYIFHSFDSQMIASDNLLYKECTRILLSSCAITVFQLTIIFQEKLLFLSRKIADVKV